MRTFLGLMVVLLSLAIPTVSSQAGSRPEDHTITAARNIVIDGTNIRVMGDIHANGDILLRGRVMVEGTAEAGRTVRAGPNARARRTVMGAPAADIGVLDFAALRQQATRILAGDQRFSGANLLSGILYVGGSVVIDGVLGGQGVIVAEQAIRVRGRILAPGSFDFIAGTGISIRGSSMTLRGRVQTPGLIDLSGDDVVIQGALIGGDVQVSGSNIQLLGVAPGASQPPRSGGPPAPGQPPIGFVPVPPVFVLPAPTLLQPQNGTRYWDDLPQLVVRGTAPPGAHVRLSLRHQQSLQEMTADITADNAGQFDTVFFVATLNPLAGNYTLTAVVIGPGGRASAATTVTFVVLNRPDR